MTKTEIVLLSHDVALRRGCNPELVKAMVGVESGFNPWAWNPEPRYRYLWNVKTGEPFRPLTVDELDDEIPPKDFPALHGDRDNEFWGQQASWGLMQVMGAVAREYGFAGKYLPQLCDPDTGLEFGCRVLVACLRWAGGDVPAALAAYNGGWTKDNGPGVKYKRNQSYVDKVYKELARG